MHTKEKQRHFDELMCFVREHTARWKPLPGEQEDIAENILKMALGVGRRLMLTEEQYLVPELILLLGDLSNKFDESREAGELLAQAKDALLEGLRRSTPTSSTDNDASEDVEVFDLDGGWAETEEPIEGSP